MAAVSATELTAAVAAGSGDAALVARLAAAADRAVQQFLGREFVAGPFTEFYPGGARLLFLAQYPVAAVLSLAVDAARGFAPDAVRPLSSFVVHPERGVVENPDGPFVPCLPGWAVRPDDYPGAVRVVYTAAAEVPADVKHAALMLAEHWFRESKTHAASGQVNRTTAADGATVPWGQAGGYRLPAGVLQLLRPHRRPAV